MVDHETFPSWSWIIPMSEESIKTFHLFDARPFWKTLKKVLHWWFRMWFWFHLDPLWAAQSSTVSGINLHSWKSARGSETTGFNTNVGRGGDIDSPTRSWDVLSLCTAVLAMISICQSLCALGRSHFVQWRSRAFSDLWIDVWWKNQRCFMMFPSRNWRVWTITILNKGIYHRRFHIIRPLSPSNCNHRGIVPVGWCLLDSTAIICSILQ